MLHPPNAVRVGVIGCGNISTVYFAAGKRFDDFEIVCCADLLKDRARASAAKHAVPRYSGVEQLLADPEVDVVLNLTVPKAHAEISLAALAAGKSVYCEKPLAIGLEEGRRILEGAGSAGLRVGSAPDTFLGSGGQTARRLVDDGAIGQPVAAVAFMLSHGPEDWHPNPDFYYDSGGGPMFDMGPYYLTALLNLLGPVRRVTGSAKASFAERTARKGTPQARQIPVHVPTHVVGVLEFTCGVVATIVTSFDVWGSNVPRIELYGSEGSLSIPDPNTFGGTVRLNRGGVSEWQDVASKHGYAEESRGVGLADMTAAMRSGRPHRASGEMAQHVLEIMHAIHVASDEGRHVPLETSCERPAALPFGLRDGTIA